jgi:predicted nucleic acid-binding protein
MSALDKQIPVDRITWAGSELRRMYAEVVELVRQTHGALNFNDAWIALLCREFTIDAIASFDQDFDRVGWLKRVAKPEDL